MKAKEPRISVRVSPELKKRIETVTENTGVDEATIVRNCLEAVCDSVEACGTLIFPLELAPARLPLRRSNPNSSPVEAAVAFAAEQALDDSTAARHAPPAPGDPPPPPVHYRKASARTPKKKPNS